MNSLTNREWEIYNFSQIAGSSEYDNILINKDIDNYFNDIINKPNPISNPNSLFTKSSYTFEKFYFDYIEHNLLFIVLLVGIVIFLVIRHYVKDFDTFSTEYNKSSVSDNNNNNDDKNNDDKNNDDKNNDDKNNDDDNDKIMLKKKIIKKNRIEMLKKQKQQEQDKIKLFNYKKQLDAEKEKILTIIDELSNMNDYEYTKSKPYPDYLNQNQNQNYITNMNYKDNYIKSQGFLNQANNYQSSAHNFDDNSQYYDINKNQDDKINEIDGVYIEPPFN